jgi:hypothetical protein
MIWIAAFKAMMGLGLSLAIEKTASAGGSPPASEELPHFTIIF